jgi:hypothetical protein
MYEMIANDSHLSIFNGVTNTMSLLFLFLLSLDEPLERGTFEMNFPN